MRAIDALCHFTFSRTVKHDMGRSPQFGFQLIQKALLAVCCFAIASGLVIDAEAHLASQISVEGNRRVEASTVRSYFQDASGNHVDAAAATDAGIKALL